MIILIVPMLSQQTLNADSNYVIIKEAVRAIWREDPRVHFLLPWPTNKEWRYYRDGFFEDPRIRRLPLRYAEAKKYNNIAFDPTFFLKTFDRFVPDLIWNMDVEIGHLLARFSQNYAKEGEPPVLNHHHFVIHKSSGAQMSVYESFIYVQILSSLLADWNVFPSRYGFQMLVDNIQEYDMYPFLDRISAKTSFLPTGIVDVPAFKRIAEAEDRHDRTTIFYNQRLAGYKGYRETFDLLAKIHKDRKGDFDVQISFQDGDRSSVIRRKYPFVRVVRNDAHEDYLKEMARCHLNVTNSRYEVLPVGIIEAIGMGQAVIAPNGISFPELLGEDYGFLYDTVVEEEEMIHTFLDDPQMIEREGNANRERAFDVFSSEKFARSLLYLFADVHALRPESLDVLKAKNLKILRSHVRGKDVLSRKDHKEYVRDAGLSTSQSMPAIRWRRIVRALGYESFLNREGAYWMKGKET